MTPANALTNSVISTMRLLGHETWRNNNVGIFDPVKKIYRKGSGDSNGLGDVCSIIRRSGQHAELEIKIKPDKPSDAQLARQKRIRAIGAIYEFIYCIDDLLSLIKREGWDR